MTNEGFSYLDEHKRTQEAELSYKGMPPFH